MPVKEVRSVGWTRRSAAVSVLLAMDDHRKQAGLRVVRLRESRNWSQEDLAHKAGLSTKTISRIENGKHDGRRATIRAIAKAFKINENEIIGSPPAPLGLDAPAREQDRDQLDRVEAKLDAILAYLEASTRAADAQELLGVLQTALDLRADTRAGTPATAVGAQGRRSRKHPSRD